MGVRTSSEFPRERETIPRKKSDELVNRNSFDYVSIVGRGGFGKVWKVYHKKYKTHFAMKEMSKAKIIDKRSEKSVKAERELLSKITHPFIINMHFAFQDSDNLYLVMDLLTGGDLRYHICKYRKFSEEQTKFFIACILLGLEYCHYNRIIHRDIKPENLVLDAQGYSHITDFGIAKIQIENNAKETSGTPGYMSPEVICAQNHTIAADYFAVGVIGYEFMMGVRPYLGKGRKEIKEKIIARQAKIRENEIPEGWSLESADCINKLLIRKPINRLGKNGVKEVKEHPWFENFDWSALYNKTMVSPFIPENEDNFDFKYCNAVEKQGLKTKERYANIFISDNYKAGFIDYYYFDRYAIEVRNEGMFVNPHEVMLNESKSVFYVGEHNRNKSLDLKFQDVNRKSPLRGVINHVRALSSSHVGNHAFFEASRFVDKRNELKKIFINEKKKNCKIQQNQKGNIPYNEISAYSTGLNSNILKN